MRSPDFILRTVESLRRILSRRRWDPLAFLGGSLSLLDGTGLQRSGVATRRVVKRLWKVSGEKDGHPCHSGGIRQEREGRDMKYLEKADLADGLSLPL